MNTQMNARSISYLSVKFMALVFVLSGSTAAHASVVIDNTRIVYPQHAKEVTVFALCSVLSVDCPYPARIAPAPDGLPCFPGARRPLVVPPGRSRGYRK
jgi:hypothetical protein